MLSKLCTIVISCFVRCHVEFIQVRQSYTPWPYTFYGDHLANFLPGDSVDPHSSCRIPAIMMEEALDDPIPQYILPPPSLNSQACRDGAEHLMVINSMVRL